MMVDTNKINILIADDEVDSCNFIQKWLLKQGYNVDVSFDGNDALAKTQTDKYDFVFLDVDMPGLTGTEIARIIKQKGLKCVTAMITGYPPEDESTTKALGVDEYLEKPFSLERIKEIIDKYSMKGKKDENKKKRTS
ncbi:MAG: response regulator [Candidatus Omnitrophica bacterium]|nr:response regulator [Candidatus Omnitrophota bacterium]MDD5352134.1 response regulator [Candidatus Omnitrophota bacterium]MDD5549732.1 response regulator [Candidatus Omnitrophota bacterium]